MRSRSRAVMMMCLAMLAAGAVATAGASAAPPEILNHSGGTLVKKKFTDTIGNGIVTGIGGSISLHFCHNASATGEITSRQGGEMSVTYKECVLENESCHTEGKAAGEVVESMTVKLVYTNRTGHQLALLYTINPTTKWIICTIEKEKLTGSYLIPVTSNSLHTEYTGNATQSRGRQTPVVYEGENGETLNTGLYREILGVGTLQFGWEFAQTLKFEEEVEFKG